MADNYEETLKAMGAGPEAIASLRHLPETLPILPLRGVVSFPLTLVPLNVARPPSVRLIDDASAKDRLIGLATLKDPTVEDPLPDQLYTIGTIATIQRMLKMPDGSVQLIANCLERISLGRYTSIDPYFRAEVGSHPDAAPPANIGFKARLRSLVDLFNKLVSLSSQLPQELAHAAAGIENPRQLLYVIASVIPVEIPKAQEILEASELNTKIDLISSILTQEIEVLELGKKIQNEAKSQIEKSQREYLLRQQLRAIQQELGETDTEQARADEFRKKIESAGMPEEALDEANRELSRLAALPAASAEYGTIENYLDWLTALPWSKSTPDSLDLDYAKRVLDEDHYDLERVKERLLEYLAVRKLLFERKGLAEPTDGAPLGERTTGPTGAILCFIGPPGVGKTSLGQSIARSLGRKFSRLSLGGVRDEAEIRGHRRTYVGALPGRIIQAIRRAGVNNPVIMLDEVDKIGTDWRGDPASALLEVLDPEQNKDFRDHYVHVPFDLSKILFITTANILDTIPIPLRDRMEIIELSGYTDREKLEIATRYLIPQQLRRNALEGAEIRFQDKAVLAIVHSYTKEAGVRELERKIGAICRKVASRVARGEHEHVVVDEGVVRAFLGKPRVFLEAKQRTELPGVATGLAVTPAGGDLLFIEALRTPGKRGLIVTGQLGEVMKESAQAALSYVRSQGAALGIDPKLLEDFEIHLHVPAGATPKDGPSAGIAMATALASMLTGRVVRDDLAMTGEITLRGKVLPVGGIKEKILAAHRGGIARVIIPARNEPDLEDVPEPVKEQITVQLVESTWEVLTSALEPAARPQDGHGAFPAAA